jgi:hypothetical protein
MNWKQICKLGRELPEVVEDTWYGAPALKVRGKGFARLKEGGESVAFVLESIEEQEFLVEAKADVYFITDHYRGYPAVLARLAKLRAGECRERLEQGWRKKAPKTLVRARAGGANR